MSPNNGIEDFLDDGFEGSNLERSIFREVFFGNELGSTSKKCLVTGAINFECESSGNADTSLCSISENSALTSHSSSKSPCLEEISHVTEGHREASELENFPKTSVSTEQNAEEVSGKQIKFSANELSNTEPDLGKESSSFPKKIVSGVSFSAKDPVSEVITLRLVECSSQGITSSCYLLKQHGEMMRGFTVGEPNASKCKSLRSEGNDAKEMVLGKAIASPASLESMVSRLFPPSLTVSVLQERSESPLHASERPQEPGSFELGFSGVELKGSLKKDPRPVLQYHAVRVLSAAGWLMEKRKRPSRIHSENVYKTPSGRPVRELAKAWRICGEILFPGRHSSVNENAVKQWNNMSQFLSDLSDTLVILNLEENSEVTNKWRLLDPFVVVALVNRRIGALRRGEVVKATQNPATRKKSKSIVQGDLPTSVSGSALAGESALISFDGNDRGFFQQSTSWLPTSGPAHGTGSTVVQSISCFCDVSLHQDGSTKCQICDGQSSEHNVQAIKEANSLENNEELLGSQVIDVEYHQLKSGDNCPSSTTPGLVPHQGFDIVNLSTLVREEDGLGIGDSISPGDVSKKKPRRKRKKISEIEPSSLYRSGNADSASVDETGLLCANENGKQLESNQNQGDIVVTPRTKGTKKKTSSLSASSHKIQKKGSKLKRNCSDNSGSKIVKKKSKKCHIGDDDLLVSAIIKNKDFSPGTSRYPSRKKACKSKTRRKRKSQKRGCRLLPNMVNAGNFKDDKWYSGGVRTVLSWLVGTKVVSVNKSIEYRNPDDNAVTKDGWITRDGVLCKCCSKVFTVSAFKIHAGFAQNHPCSNLFLDSEVPYTLRQLEAWSAEYKSRKGGAPAVKVDDEDRNDDSCGLCGDGGELICCDNCPSTFHQACLSTQDLPEGNWYCANCTCWVCGSLVNDKDISSDSCGLKCSQCEHKYHDACLKEKCRYQGAVSEAWCCSRSCYEVCSGLQSSVGVTNNVGDGFAWSLLKCIHDDQKVHSNQGFALKAECNSKLSVALTIMEECFLSMVDPRTGIDMIPHAIYNWGSDFARLNFQGFYTMVLEKDDVLISVACIRVHGSSIAEMPLIATCSKYRRQGMCRILVNAIEEMLISFKVEKIVVAAIPDLVETWTKGFGFELIEESEKRSLSKINMMVFPGTVLLKKRLYDNGNNTHGQSGDPASLLSEEPWDEFKQQVTDPHFTAKASELGIGANDAIRSGEPRVDCKSSVEIGELTNIGICSEDTDASTKLEHKVSAEFNTLQDLFSKVSCEEELGACSNVESLYGRDDETQLVCDVNVK